MTHGGSAPAALDAALERIAGCRRLLVALDFDGTLAPEVDDPLAARALPAAAAALDALQALPETFVALVSGRSLESLAHVGQVAPGTPLVGSHGLEVRIGAGDPEPAVDDADRNRVVSLRAALAPLVDAVDGAWIEDKPAGFAVHTRVVVSEAAGALQRDVRERASALDPGLTVRDGKNVIEFAVRDATKGDGLRILRDRLGVDAVLFAGDDVTDEDALRVLGEQDLGIKVGAAATVAEHRVADPAAMAALLAELAERRRGIVSGSTR
ncbi:MAG: trehalose-phosphatase [Microcella sp.]|uniref:trehalose-phosphatase n=1 Tax=Microcella sp. TaxID=1913979 RepID=UPI0033154AB9